MGHDFDAINEDGEYVTGTIRICSGNWYDMWEKYSTGPYIWHGHSSKAIIDNINTTIEKVIAGGCKIVNGQNCLSSNVNFYFGVNADCSVMNDQDRLSAFHAWLVRWREIVEPRQNLWWYSDQVCSIRPYQFKSGIMEQGKERIKFCKSTDEESNCDTDSQEERDTDTN